MSILSLNGAGFSINSKFGYHVHPLAIDFANRVIANGGNDISSKYYPLDFWIKSYKNESLWSSLIAVYTFMGGNGSTGSKNSFAVNLVSSSYTLTGVNVTDAMCTASGYTGNGTTSYFDTGILGTDLTNNNTNLSFYAATSGSNTQIIDMGFGGSGVLQVGSKFGFQTYLTDMYSAINGTGRLTGSYAISNGFVSASRISASYFGYYVAGILVASTTLSNGSLYGNKIFLGGQGNNNVFNTSYASDRRYSHFGINKGFTSSQELTRAIIQQSFENMLARAV